MQVKISRNAARIWAPALPQAIAGGGRPPLHGIRQETFNTLFRPPPDDDENNTMFGARADDLTSRNLEQIIAPIMQRSLATLIQDTVIQRPILQQIYLNPILVLQRALEQVHLERNINLNLNNVFEDTTNRIENTLHQLQLAPGLPLRQLDFENEPQTEQFPNVENPEIRRFIKDGQNTHTTSVTQSVSASLLRLKERYVLKEEEISTEGKINLKESTERVLNEIKTFLRNCSLSNREKDTILSWFDSTLIIHNDTSDAASGLTLREILALVWQGICDQKCINKDKLLSDSDIEDRKLTLLKRIHELKLTGVCFFGNKNDLVSTLELIHPDVIIHRFRNLPETKNLAYRSTTNHLVAYVKNQFLKLPPKDAVKLYDNWDTSENPIKDSFMAELKKENLEFLKQFLKQKLQEDYGDLLDEVNQNLIVQEILDGALDYLARPEVNINSIKKRDPARNQEIELLFNKFINIINDTDFKSKFAKKRREPELNNRRLPDRVYLMYKTCKVALAEISGINDSPENVSIKGDILLNALEAIKDELNKAKNGVNWKKWNRSSVTSSFYSQRAADIEQFF